jgi:hypothetical protein
MDGAAAYDEAMTSGLKQYLTKVIQEDEWPAVKDLIEKKADPNVNHPASSGGTILHQAAAANKVDLIDILWRHGADLEIKSSYGQTPLEKAAHRGNRQAVIKLIALGANIGPFISAHAYDDAKEVLSHYLEKAGSREEHWFYALIRQRQNDALRHILNNSSQVSLEPLIHQKDDMGNTPFDIALVTRNREVILLLCLRGADPLWGLYNGVFFAQQIKEWQRPINEDANSNEPSLYEQILKAALYVCWITHEELEKNLPKELSNKITQIMIAIR